MSVPARLATFAFALVLTFGAGAALGAAVGPLDDAPNPESPMDHEPSAN